jgi:tetratricopeptide (TPR) repeat protein
VPSAPSGPSRPQEEAENLRLDSWKEIAVYLGKGERTAKRWESERSLPVHRLPGGGRGSVLAFTAELDAWLISAKTEKLDLDDEANGAIEAGREAEAGEPAFSLSQDEAQLAPESRAASSAARKAHGSAWHIPVFILLPAGLALAAVFLVHLRIAGAPTPSQQPARPASSEVEKRLAHELYLKGRFEWSQRTPESLNRALDDFTQALVHDPGNAQNYVGLADTYNLLREYSLMPPNEAYSRAIAASKKAVELDDSLAEAHRALAFDEVFGNWDFKTGEKEFRRAIELNPRDPLAHLWFANAFAAPGWYKFCLHEIDRAQELNPASPSILADKGAMLFSSGHREQGIELLKQVERSSPEFLSPHRYLANFYLALRDYPNFLLESEKEAELKGDLVLKVTNFAAWEGYRQDGERGLLKYLYRAQKKFYDQGELSGTVMARTCVLLGKKEEAMQLLREDYQKHKEMFLLIRTDQILADLKNEPEFEELIRDLHLPAPETAADTDSAAGDLIAGRGGR